MPLLLLLERPQSSPCPNTGTSRCVSATMCLPQSPVRHSSKESTPSQSRLMNASQTRAVQELGRGAMYGSRMRTSMLLFDCMKLTSVATNLFRCTLNQNMLTHNIASHYQQPMGATNIGLLGQVAALTPPAPHRLPVAANPCHKPVICKLCQAQTEWPVS